MGDLGVISVQKNLTSGAVTQPQMDQQNFLLSHNENLHDIQLMGATKSNLSGFMNVWKSNLDQAFELLGETLRKGFTYVAMDTEFPGI
ncbi:MAG: CCR4-NOT transcription complex subunit 8, partial [Paramarteilia canceri]